MSFFVSPAEFAATKDRVAALNKRAAKAGIDALVSLVEIDRKVIESRNEFGFTTKETVIQAELQGVENIRIAGSFKLAATLDHDVAGNIFRTNLAFEGLIPTEFRGTDSTRCDHCGIRRHRNQTVLVFSETEGFKQVGSDCVKLFLGVSPATLIAFMRELDSLVADDEGFGGGRARNNPSVIEFVAIAALVTEVYGFVPKSFIDKTPTAEIVNEFINPGQDFRKKFPELASLRNPLSRTARESALIERANELAEGALAWIADQKDSGDYILNLRLAAAREDVGRNSGLLASLPNAYKKATAKAAEKAAKETLPASEHVGQIGDKITFTAKVIYTNRSEGYAWNSPDSLFVILLGEDGNKYYTNTTVVTAFGIRAEDAGKDDLIKITATVKGHKVTDKGDKVTVITRAKEAK